MMLGVIKNDLKNNYYDPQLRGLDFDAKFKAAEEKIKQATSLGQASHADVIMSDGKSVEYVGVTPDELLLPTAEDMAAQRDPVLARAMAIAGGKISPEIASKLFPLEWRKLL